jgi:hypothetical protein
MIDNKYLVCHYLHQAWPGTFKMGESNNRSGSRFYTFFFFCVLYAMLSENDTPGHILWFCILHTTK